MTEDELESIRERKRQRLLGGEESEEGGSDAGTEAVAPDEPVHVESVEQFSEVTTRYDVVLVDFYADWCGPCKMLEPVVASVAANTDAAVAKVDIDQQQGLATQYGVRSVPTLLLFADGGERTEGPRASGDERSAGKPVEQVVGVQDEDKLTTLVERYS